MMLPIVLQNMQSVLTPAQLAVAIGVSESSVKRWIDGGRIVASRTAGGHRRVSAREAVRFIRDSGVGVAGLGLPGLERDPGEALFELLRDGRAQEAAELLQARFLAGASVAEIVDGALVTAMKLAVDLDCPEEEAIFVEHRVTEAAIQAFTRLRSLIAPATDESRLAIGCAPEGDPYVLPSLAVAAVVEDEGFRAVNLGPDTPFSSLVLGVRSLRPRIVWISFSFVAEPERQRQEVLTLAREVRDQGAVLVVGGAQVERLALRRQKSVFVGASMAELRGVLCGLAVGTPAPNG